MLRNCLNLYELWKVFKCAIVFFIYSFVLIQKNQKLPPIFIVFKGIGESSISRRDFFAKKLKFLLRKFPKLGRKQDLLS